MKGCRPRMGRVVGWALLFLLEASGVGAGDEVANATRRYRAYELSSGFYESHEVRPMGRGTYVVTPEAGRLGAPSAGLYHRGRLADSHRGILFYANRRCEACHPDNAASRHVVRGNLACRQCHGGEPIAGIAHYYSPMNPIRRHAYVCARCHEGAGASFATYRVHEPPVASVKAKQGFPSLYYTYQFMLWLLIAVLGFFSLHALGMACRELVSKGRARS
ncbi:hypothetical protein [Desulfoluna sp.]|uniref:hypothetical protein n=1 Tax=Desulfoluna sp. TaxID=2045199 RepID=UPI002627A49F|nr:hypothetical protein [Desulfoluna sp.]